MKHLDTNTFGPWAMITGASSGIGEEFARQLAASGLHLMLVARRLSALQALGSELARTFGIQYRAVGLDLTTDDVLDTLSEATQDLDLGLVISNAGAMIPGDFLRMERQALRRDLRLNVQAHLDLTHHFGQRLAQRGRGGLLLVASVMGLQGVPFVAEYAAAKAYVLTLGEALHVEFQKAGVHVTVLSPGSTDTPMIEVSGFDPAQMPLKPMATRQCVAEGLAALSANRATYIPGSLNRFMATMMPRSLATRMYGSMMRQTIAGQKVSTTSML
ncbi:MAG TPA: SDR family NAD(P)-dependent oxidoreductase [Ktedonobacteraceae bacterium]|nr:SDR family NAD(P)-dependent oxidoreductase [Ktedonobacteraceae bacterium]